MRHPILCGALVAVIGTLASCTTGARSDSPRNAAARFIAAETKAWRTGILDDLQALEREDVVFHLPDLELRGWQAHADYILKARPLLTGLKQDWTYLAGDGNVFALGYRSTAIMTSPAGAPVNLSADFLCVVRLVDGKIAEVWMNGTSTPSP